VEHLGHDVDDVINTCRVFRANGVECISAVEHDALAALGLLVYDLDG
jgi:hypothetical protein